MPSGIPNTSSERSAAKTIRDKLDSILGQVLDQLTECVLIGAKSRDTALFALVDNREKA